MKRVVLAFAFLAFATCVSACSVCGIDANQCFLCIGDRPAGASVCNVMSSDGPWEDPCPGACFLLGVCPQERTIPRPHRDGSVKLEHWSRTDPNPMPAGHETALDGVVLFTLADGDELPLRFTARNSDVFFGLTFTVVDCHYQEDGTEVCGSCLHVSSCDISFIDNLLVPGDEYAYTTATEPYARPWHLTWQGLADADTLLARQKATPSWGVTMGAGEPCGGIGR